MKRFNISLLLFMLVTLLTSCYEDKGNYDYKWVPEIEVLQGNGGFRDTVIMRGQHLTIIPDIKMIQKQEDLTRDTVRFEPERFSFKWTAYLNSIHDRITVLSTSQNLDTTINLDISGGDPYRVTYAITEKETGVTWSFNFYLRVGTRYENAWLFLTEDEEGKADLTLYGKELNNTSEDPWVWEHGVLERSGFPYRGGGAKFVYSYSYRNTSRIYVGTGESTGWIGKNDLAWNDKQLVRFQMAAPEPVNFTFENIIYTMVYHFIASNGAIYPMGNDGLIQNPYNLLPPGITSSGKYESVKLSPYIGGNSMTNLVYDETNEVMYSYMASSGSVQTTVKNNLEGDSRMEKHKLYYMQPYSNTMSIVIAKNKVNNKYYKYVYTTSPGEPRPKIVETVEILNGQLLEEAEHFVCPWNEKGNFYMSVGSDLYALRENELKKVNVLDPEGVIKEGFNGFAPICLLTRYTNVTSTRPYIMVADYAQGEENSGKVYFLEPVSTEPLTLIVKNYYPDMGQVKGISRF